MIFLLWSYESSSVDVPLCALNTEHLAYCDNYARAASRPKRVPVSVAVSHARQDKASTLTVILEN